MTQTVPSNPKFDITFLRHGESVANADGFRQGQADFPLTQKGQEQVRSLAAHWQKNNIAFDKIVSSPLSRARETMEIINAHLKLPTEIDPIWMERDIGVLSGLSNEEVLERFPSPSFIPLYQPIGETGESQWDLFLRAGKAVSDLIKQNGGRYLVITHGGLLNMVLLAVLGLAPQANFQGVHFRISNTGFLNLTYNPTIYHWEVNSFNNSHGRSTTKAENSYGLSSIYQFTFLRHGESLANLQGRIQGQTNSPLSTKGIKEAESLADYWHKRNPGFERIISSPLERAYLTGEIIAQSLGLPMETDDIWMEKDFGNYSGMHMEELPDHFPSTVLYEPYTPIGKTGESRWESYLRAGRALQDLANRSPGNYLIIAHGGILNMLMHTVMGITPQTNMTSPSFRFSNTGFARVNYDPRNHKWSVLSINECPHI